MHPHPFFGPAARTTPTPLAATMLHVACSSELQKERMLQWGTAGKHTFCKVLSKLELTAPRVKTSSCDTLYSNSIFQPWACVSIGHIFLPDTSISGLPLSVPGELISIEGSEDEKHSVWQHYMVLELKDKLVSDASSCWTRKKTQQDIRNVYYHYLNSFTELSSFGQN